MTERLTPEGYEQTKAKLLNLERRLASWKNARIFLGCIGRNADDLTCR